MREAAAATPSLVASPVAATDIVVDVSPVLFPIGGAQHKAVESGASEPFRDEVGVTML
jgi:hypothetical protein